MLSTIIELINKQESIDEKIQAQYELVDKTISRASLNFSDPNHISNLSIDELLELTDIVFSDLASTVTLKSRSKMDPRTMIITLKKTRHYISEDITNFI